MALALGQAFAESSSKMVRALVATVAPSCTATVRQRLRVLHRPGVVSGRGRQQLLAPISGVWGRAWLPLPQVLEVCPALRADCTHVASTFPRIVVPVRGGHSGRRAAEATSHADTVLSVMLVLLSVVAMVIRPLSVVVIHFRPVVPMIVVVIVRPVVPLTVVAMEIWPVNGLPR